MKLRWLNRLIVRCIYSKWYWLPAVHRPASWSFHLASADGWPTAKCFALTPTDNPSFCPFAWLFGHFTVLYLLLRSGSVTNYKHVTGIKNWVWSLYFIHFHTFRPLDIPKNYEFVHSFKRHFFRISFYIIPASTPRSSKWSAPSMSSLFMVGLLRIIR
jgi:hypothetical protein